MTQSQCLAKFKVKREQFDMREIKSTELLQQFASDNYSGICPEAWASMAMANRGHALAYGNDPWTTAAADAFRDLFETDCEVFFAFNGTAANSLALASLCRSYHAVICCQSAHVETDECGAPEFFSNGSKLLVAESRDGKLTPKAIQELATNRGDIHYPKPRAVTISQSTETGRVYTVEELRALSAVCVKHGLRLHMDGARFANACASLGCSPADLTWILFFNRKLAEDFDYRCKQAGQLASKMRFLAAPWVGMLESGAWLRNAEHANASARYLASQISEIEGIRVVSEPEANAVFVSASDEILEALRQLGWKFYTFIGGAARFMCSWDTDQSRIDEFCNDLRMCAESALATRSRG